MSSGRWKLIFVTTTATTISVSNARTAAGRGRDHWPLTNAIGISGAGVRMGSIIDATDSKCERVVCRENSTLDYAATIFKLLGIDDTQEYISNDGRPLQINNGGRAIDDVFA